MKERITYILAEGEQGVNPSNVQVSSDSLKLPGLRAAKEWRITLSTKELPRELRDVLDDSHELHVRWASLQHIDSTPPFSARTPPGLHIFYTPVAGDRIGPGLCTQIKNIFGPQLRCDSVQDAFSQPQVLSGRFASSSAWQYYQQLPLLDTLQHYLKANYCPNSPPSSTCIEHISNLQQASSLDLDFDAISQSLVITARWPPAYHNQKISKRSPDDRVEVGLLNREQSTEDEKISLGGFLTVIGDDDEPKPTLFSFPSRHRQLPSSGPESVSYTVSFKKPTGLHPTLQLTFDKNDFEPPLPSCALHAYLTLPSTLFVDRYQLFDGLFLRSQNLESLRTLSGETDLEAPDWVISKWGSAALFELAVPEDVKTKGPWTVSIPTHLRYLPPRASDNGTAMYPEYLPASPNASQDKGKRTTTMPYPAVFWACPAESGLRMATNPFDRINLGYDGLFGPKTLYWHVQPSVNGTGTFEVEVDVPVLNLAKTRKVELVTGLVVLVGFMWICWQIGIVTVGGKSRKKVVRKPSVKEMAKGKKKAI